MKKSWLYGCSFILLSIFATACGDDEKDIYGIFYADIVTCHTNKGNPYFTYQTTDSAPVDTLYPVSEVNSDDMGEGVRVWQQYAHSVAHVTAIYFRYALSRFGSK